VVVLLGAMIPLGFVLESSGAAQTLANLLVYFGDWASPEIVLLAVLVSSILLADMINTAGAAVLMSPIAILLAQGLGVSVDPFLMAVAIGGSCAFLTPIGHQANTLVMGPGGYKFGDYWRMGLPLDIIIVVLSMFLIPKFWPL
jgi:di/tricarboxylate transporter